MDVYSAIEIVDNSGRTPIFESVEKEHDLRTIIPSEQIIYKLAKPKSQPEGGYGAKVNILNYNG